MSSNFQSKYQTAATAKCLFMVITCHVSTCKCGYDLFFKETDTIVFLSISLMLETSKRKIKRNKRKTSYSSPGNSISRSTSSNLK